MDGKSEQSGLLSLGVKELPKRWSTVSFVSCFDTVTICSHVCVVQPASVKKKTGERSKKARGWEGTASPCLSWWSKPNK